MRTPRKIMVGVAGVLASAGLALGAVAYACTSLATLNTSAPAGNPGSTVTVSGSGFASAAQGAGGHASAAGPPAPVILHWDGINGPVLGQTEADRAGNISTSIAIPQDAAPGPHVIVATQQNARGQTVSGTPARAPFQVNGANGQPAAPAQPAADPARPAADGSNGTGIAIGAIGLMLFAGGFVTFLVARRQTGRGAGARVGRR